MFAFKLIPKTQFFDRELLLKKMGKARRKQLGRAGGAIRVTAQRSMRYAPIGKHSPPGLPPKAHQPNPLLRKHLYYAYDGSRNSVVAGSMALNVSKGGSVGGQLRSGKGLVPEIMEFGGSVRLREIQRPGAQGAAGEWRNVPTTWKPRGERRIPVWTLTPAERIATRALAIRLDSVRKDKGATNFYVLGPEKERIRTAVIAKRPYMGPALIKNRQKIVGFWVNSII